MKKQDWIRARAYELWELSNYLENHDLDFWLLAEQEYLKKEKICVLSSNNCKFQETLPSIGGQQISYCKKKGSCTNRAVNYL